MTFSLENLLRDPDTLGPLKLAVVVAHPDDEVLGCGILLSRLRPPHDVNVIHITDGAPREGDDAARLGFDSPQSYAAARRTELAAAMALAALAPDRLVSLDIADQAASANLVPIAHRLVPLLWGLDAVFTHAYEGGHPDHDATAFAVHAAARLLGDKAPAVIEMPFYRASPDDWLRQDFVPVEGAAEAAILVPTEADRGLKQRMYEAHASQAEILAGFPIGPERFRVAPAYRFDVLPNGGLLLYERYGWGATGATWLAKVEAAEAELSRPASE